MSESNIKQIEEESQSKDLSDSEIRGILDFPRSPDSDIHSDNSSQKSEPKPEPKPEQEPEVKSEPKTEPKSEQQSEPKSGQKKEEAVGAIEKKSSQNGETKKQKLGKNKWVLLLFVAGGTGIVLFIIGLIYTKVLNTGSRILDRTTVVVEENEKEEEEEIAEKTQGEQLAEANAKVALVQQQTQLKAIEGQLEQQEDHRLVKKAEPSPEPVKIETIPQPQPRSNQRAVSTQNQARASRVQPSSASKPKPEPIIHTAADWYRLAALGDFGYVNYGSNDENLGKSKVVAPKNEIKAENKPPRPKYSPNLSQIPKALPKYPGAALEVVTTQKQSPLELITASTAIMAQKPTAEEINILQGRRRQRIQIGQQAQAHLVTPLLWVAAEVATQENFVVELDQPILDTREQVLLPVGTQILLRIKSVHPSGLVISEAHTLLKDGVEYAVPPGVLRIRGNSGNPLIASQRGQAGGKIARRDTLAFTVGALGQVGEVLNRPDSEINTFSTSGFSQSRTDNDNPDLVGAVLEGGFQPLAKDIQERNRQATGILLSRPQIWELDAGSSVQVFVNGTFEL